MPTSIVLSFAKQQAEIDCDVHDYNGLPKTKELRTAKPGSDHLPTRWQQRQPLTAGFPVPGGKLTGRVRIAGLLIYPQVV